MLQKIRHPASEALVTLRNALDMNQADFSRKLLKMSKVTLARYETSHPPTGDILLRLAEIAEKRASIELRNQFRLLYLDEIFNRLKLNLVVRMAPDRPAYGFLLQRLEGHEVIAAEAFIGALNALRSGDSSQHQAAAKAFAALGKVRELHYKKQREPKC